MPDIIDLSNINKTSQHDEYASLSEEDKERLSQMAEENPAPQGERVATAFLVVIGEKGEVGVLPDITTPIIRDHVPTNDELYSAVCVIRKDIETQEAAQHTAAFMHQLAQAAQAQMQSQALAARLNLPK